MRSLALKAVIASLVAAIVLAACAKRSAEGPGPQAGKTLSIAVIPKGTTHEFWKSIHAGAIETPMVAQAKTALQSPIPS